ncbi:MAG: DUF2334 domain-containing protein [bacterium]|nr:DUF2334 domain-containing protein [bacterium]
MGAKYVIRLDDICPTMNWDNFLKLESIFRKYNVKPIIGVVPDNVDKKLMVQLPLENFWSIIKGLLQEGWVVAQHGYQHKYINQEGGLLKISRQSEFAGCSYDEQLIKIRAGKEILERELDTKIEWWMAPAHSFDEQTCNALREVGFKYITDGIAVYPFKKFGLIWVPQQLWRPRKKLIGVWTICVHPNTIDDIYIQQLEFFIRKNINNIHTDYAKLVVSGNSNIINKVYRYFWTIGFRLYKLLIKKT